MKPVWKILRSRAISGAAVVVAFGALTGCNTNPAKDKPKAEVAEAVVPAAPAAAPASAAKYAFSQEGSKLEWVGAKVSAKHDGGFRTFSGTIELPEGNPEKGSVSVEIDTASVFSDTEKLTGHLKSPDFFDVEKYPKARFTSTSIRPGGDNGATHTVTGNLELHGVTKSISFPAKIRVDADQVAVDAEFGINRKDFGIVYPGMPDDLIRDDVLIRLEVRAKRSST
ncbi:MAG: YceI family protein [Pseudomonadota bacterium]|nr:MAG: YceI family protein [Pseudomonadota bacterium]